MSTNIQGLWSRRFLPGTDAIETPEALAPTELGPSLGRIGPLELRLATRKKDIRRAQRLRWTIFYEQGGAIADRRSALTRRDICPFDAICDHLVVYDHTPRDSLLKRKSKVVGTYRLLRQDVAEAHSGFYSASEFDIAPLLMRHKGKRFLELGRSCVLPEYRGKRTLELLWRGIWAYVEHHRIDVMIGCASIEGADPDEHRELLAFLRKNAAASEEWNASPLAQRRVDIAPQAHATDTRRALAAMPPLIKGYLRAGGRIGDGAVVDHQFGTTDVFVVMPVAEIDTRYLAHFAGSTKAA